MSDKEYRGNMPETTETYIRAVLADEGYTWVGFVECLARNLKHGDIEDIHYFLGEHLKAKGVDNE